MSSTKTKRKPRFHTSTIKIHDIDYNRNGVCGKGFWSLLFEDPETPEECEKGLFVATVFPDQGYCAVLKMDRLSNGEVKYNNWRGDFYEDALRKAIQEEKDKQDKAMGLTKWPKFKGQGKANIEEE